MLPAPRQTGPMPLARARIVSACQYVLVLATVAAVLLPAAGVVRVDLAPIRPATTPVAGKAGAAVAASAVENRPVTPAVREIPLVPAPAPGLAGRRVARPAQVTSAAEPVEGYGAIGVVWAARQRVPEESLRVQARTQTDGVWSPWTDVVYDSEHGPDPDSPEADRARPGTDPLLVGHVDQVQVRASSTRPAGVPAGLSLAVISPGESTRRTTEKPAIDTGALPGARIDETARVDDNAGIDDNAGAASEATGTRLALRSGTVTARPQIYSRAQWGADESLRDPSSLRYYEVHAGFVHHTVNANDYTRAEVPGIIRSIYAYHVRTRGWSDVGYNFLIDRFGRIWEGRYGGVGRPVVGAHTLNYNDYSFAAAAIGNFELTAPSEAMIDAYSRLFAWKLALHGVNAASTAQLVGGHTFRGINGHRDAALTACPGKNLYAKIPEIRTGAAALQDWSGRSLDRDLVGAAYPDLVVRKRADQRLYVVPTGGGLRLLKGQPVSAGWGAYAVVTGTPDLTGDRRPDLVTATSTGMTRIHPGDGAGGFGAGRLVGRQLAGLRAVTAAGDVNADGRNDLAGIRVSDGRLVLLMGQPDHSLGRRVLGLSLAGYNLLAGPGDITGDRRADLVARTTSGRLVLFAARQYHSPRILAGTWSGYDTITGFGDYTRDGNRDLFLRNTAGQGFVLPGTGAGSFGPLIGPIARVKGFTHFTGGGQLGGAATPDLVGRVGDRLVIVRSRGTVPTLRPVATGIDGSGLNALLNAGDWDRDGYGDLITRTKAGTLQLRLGAGNGRFETARTLSTGFAGVRLLAAVGDVTGDGFPDLMGQPKGQGMRIYPGGGAAGLGTSLPAYGAITAGRQLGGGRWDGDGAPDSLFISSRRLSLLRGNGPGGLTGSAVPLGLDLTPYDWVGTSNQLNGKSRTIVLVRETGTGVLRSVSVKGSQFGAPRVLGLGFDAYDLIG